MSDDKKPREFWLGNEYVDVKGHGKYYSWKRVNPEHPSDVHVIEHSAYAALKKENEELKSALLGDCEAEHVKVEKENASLRESLKEAIGIINAISPCNEYDVNNMYAKRMLAKIKAKHGEL